MRLSILATALALGAQITWAQEATDPGLIPDDTELAVEETTAGDTNETTTETTTIVDVTDVDEDTGTVEEEVVVDGTDVVDGGLAEETETEVAEQDVGDVTEDQTEVVLEGSDEPVVHDNRSATGAFHGGHHGQVSTMARAGLGPVFGRLRSQGYGNIQIEQVGDEIMVEATSRDGQIRHLKYDATTGALLSDEQSQPSLMQAITSKFRNDPMGKTGKVSSPQGAKSWGSGGPGKSGSAPGRSGEKGGSGGKSSNGHGGGSNAGGNGKGNGGGNGGGHGKNK
jgi:hypothetical protein